MAMSFKSPELTLPTSLSK